MRVTPFAALRAADRIRLLAMKCHSGAEQLEEHVALTRELWCRRSGHPAEPRRGRRPAAARALLRVLPNSKRRRAQLEVKVVAQLRLTVVGRVALSAEKTDQLEPLQAGFLQRLAEHDSFSVFMRFERPPGDLKSRLGKIRLFEDEQLLLVRHVRDDFLD